MPKKRSSLYEVLARVHGPKLVPQIDDIVKTIIKTLSSSAGAFALHQACSKVVPAIARYAIDPTTEDDRKRHVIHSLCKPLSDCLLGSQENLSSGAALCLQALVESDNWRFASNEMVNEVCQRVAGALEKHSQTNSHMALVTVLAKHNSLIVEAYARLLIQSGLHILNTGFLEANSQKQLSAIHMVSSLMRCLDPKSILSELELVIEEMEKCQSDRMPFVTGAAFEAIQIAKRLYAEKGSNFDRKEKNRRKNICSYGDQSPLSASTESQSVDSSIRYDSFNESPTSMNQGHQSVGCDDHQTRIVNRKLWQRCEDGLVDVSLKDGIFSELARGSDITTSECGDFSHNTRYYPEKFSGFVQGSTGNGVARSRTPSPQRGNSHINVNDVKIFTTPRKLIRSLQDVDDFDSVSNKQFRRLRSPMTNTFMGTHESICEHNDLLNGDKLSHGSSESVSSTEDVFVDKDQRSTTEVIPGNKPRFPGVNNAEKNHYISARSIFGGLFVLFAVFLCLLGVGDQDTHHVLVPT